MGAMKYRIHTTSRKAWSAMMKAIGQAQTSIYIEMYIFLDDTSGRHDFISLLKSKAQSGVEVIIVADAFGSSNLKKQTIADLKAAGVDILFFSHFLHRTHRKIIIVDNRVAFLGGVNIEKKIINWLDIQIEINGRKTVQALLRSFAYTYKMCGGRNPKILNFHKKTILKKLKSLVLENLPGHNLYTLVDYYKNRLLNAKESIKIVTPYFIPPRWLLALFDEALKRGVNIEIIIPQDTDIKILNKINYSNIQRLMNLGIKFYAAPTMNHAKILIIDNVEGLIGSQNIDAFSLNRNFEVGAFFRQKDLVRDLNAIFEKWKHQAKSYQNLNIKLTGIDKLKVRVLRLFFSII
jgi:cardiolipin synthase